MITYSGLFHKYWEINCDENMVTVNPAMDNVTMIFVIFFWVAVASSFWFFSKLSEVNLVKAVGNASRVSNEKVEARKLRIDRVPMSVWVKAFVFVTIM